MAASGRSSSQRLRPRWIRAWAASTASPSSSSRVTASSRSCSAAAGSPFAQRRPPILESKRRPLTGVGDVRQNTLQEIHRLRERDRALRVPGGAEAGASTASSARPAPIRCRATSIALPVPPPEGVRCAGVEALPLRHHRVGGDGLLRQRVAPRVGLARVRVLLDELLGDRRLERGEDGRFVVLGDLDEQRVVERATEDGRGPQDLDLPGVESPHAKQHGLAHRLGQPQGLGRPVLQPAAVRTSSRRSTASFSISSSTNGFPSERACATSATRAHLVGVEDRGDQLADQVRRHRLHRDGLGDAGAAPDPNHARQRMEAVELVARYVASSRTGCSRAGVKVVEQLARRTIGPVHVVENEQEAAVVRPHLEERDDRFEQPELRLLRISAAAREDDADQLREQLAQLDRERARSERRASRSRSPSSFPIASTNARYGSELSRRSGSGPRGSCNRASARSPRPPSRAASCRSRPRPPGGRSARRRGWRRGGILETGSSWRPIRAGRRATPSRDCHGRGGAGEEGYPYR